MKIVIDHREHKLIQSCKELVIPYEIQNLALGDIQIIDTDNSIQMLIERKTWSDLASSIIDNRYKEQHARYKHWALENNCNIWYILEGNKRFRTPAQEKRTLSAHMSLCFDKHTRIVETKSPRETMEWIHRLLQKTASKGFNWCNCGIVKICSPVIQDTNMKECDIELATQKVSKIGKKEHSLYSTWIAMLSCIYGMSVQKSKAIIEDWETPEHFVRWITDKLVEKKNKLERLSKIVLKDTKNKRKLGKVLSNRILNHFCMDNIVKE